MATMNEDDREIIVVDDHSSDGSADFLGGEAFSGVRLVRPAKRVGISGGRNVGGHIASGEVIVFSDAHVEAIPGWAGPMYRAAMKPWVGEVAPAVGPLLRKGPVGYGFTWRDPSLKMCWLGRRGDVPYAVPFLCGCFVAMRRDIFAMTGGFDEGLMQWGSEDAELSLRIWRMGYECQVVPAAHVKHRFRKVFPYEVQWTSILHNTFRLATVHLPEGHLRSIVSHFVQHPCLSDALAYLMNSNVHERRQLVEETAVVPAKYILDRFDMRGIA